MRLRGIDAHGMSFERTLEGFDAVVVHHEVDHLNGVLFLDRVATPTRFASTPYEHAMKVSSLAPTSEKSTR